MPRSLAKVRAKVTKKRGNTGTLHENSKDAQRLQRAELRDEKLARMAVARSKQYQPLLQRVSFFQKVAQRIDGGLEGVIHDAIRGYIHRDDEELVQLKSLRRPGRASSVKEDLLKRRIAQEEKEYATGFYVPDLADPDSLDRLKVWGGEWAALGTIKFVRIRSDKVVQPASFPPKGGA